MPQREAFKIWQHNTSRVDKHLFLERRAYLSRRRSHVTIIQFIYGYYNFDYSFVSQYIAIIDDATFMFFFLIM